MDSGSETGSDAGTGVGTRVDDGRTTWGQPWDAVWIHYNGRGDAGLTGMGGLGPPESLRRTLSVSNSDSAM